MNAHLQQLEALSRHPALQVSPEQRPEIVANILHHLMHPYFLTRTPEMQEKFGERQYQAFMQALADYCLRGYVENPEPRLTIAFIQGLHRQFYANAPSVPVKAVDGSMTTIVPGEFKTTRVLIRRHNVPGEWFDTTAPEDVTRDIERLLELIHDERVPLFQRYSRLILDFGCIHPFPDGNGKTYMLLGDLFLLKQGIQPPYYAKCKQENEARIYGLYDDYFLDSQRDVSILYPLLVEAYAGCGLVLPPPALPATDLPAQVLERLLAETRAAIAAGDLPVGCVLTVGDTLLSSHRNTVRSQEGRRFHAERNLLESLDKAALPAGRQVLWVTLEPCLRRAQAIRRFGVDEVVYVLDDPFGGGKALLVQAGIAVVRRKEWERDYLGLVMDFYARYPEFCAVRQFGQALAAWQLHQPLGRGELVKAVFLRHLAAYLPIVPKARQEEVRRSFLAQVDYLVGVTLAECAGIPSMAFIAKLHRTLFPLGFRHRAVGNDGRESDTASGEWRRHVLWPYYIAFSAPETIERDLAALLDRLSAKAAWQRADALQFFLEFLSVHPFTDANGRLAAILADVICLNFGLAPLAVDIKNPLFKTAFWEDVRGGAPVESQLRLVDGWNRGELRIKPRSIYDAMPSAFQTYARRLGDKRHVVDQVLAKLAGRSLGRHFVVTDIGAGTGNIADGILHGLSQHDGLEVEYHFLEPSQTSVDYFRAHSRHAALPQVVFHVMPVEDFLLPPSDLIVVSQALQYIPNFQETLRDIVSALKPGGMALVVVTHPTGDEFELVNRLAPINGIHPRVKAALDCQKIEYEETVVESLVNISAADQGTSEGEDLLAFYFRQPAHALQPALKEAFWHGVEELSEAGGIRKKEAFFWLTQRCSEMNSSRSPLASGPLPPVANGMMASIRHAGSICPER